MQFTVVAPRAKLLPLAGEQVTLAVPQLSVAVTLKVTSLAHEPPLVLTLALPAQVSAGASVSVTVMVNEQVFVLPWPSSAKQFTVVAPRAKGLPLAGAQVTLAVPQLSLAVTVKVTLLAQEPPLVPTTIGVAQAEDGAQALAQFREHRPDVTLMDVRMPVLDGIEATRQLRAEFPSARILMLTTYDTEEDVRRALDAGASGYLLKNAKQAELVEAVFAVHRGERWLPKILAKRAEKAANESPLFPRQLEVLELLAKGLSNKEIASVLGFTADGAKSHLKSIYAKLGVQDRTEAVVTAIQRGLVRVDG